MLLTLKELGDPANTETPVHLKGKSAFDPQKSVIEAAACGIRYLVVLIGDPDAQSMAAGPPLKGLHGRFEILLAGALGGEQLEKRVREIPAPFRGPEFGNVARRGKYALNLAGCVPVYGSVVKHVGGPAGHMADGQRIIPDQSFGDNLLIALVGFVRLGEVIGKTLSDQAFPEPLQDWQTPLP